MQILSIGRKKRIHAIAFSPDSRELACACGDAQLRIWDLASGEVRHCVPMEQTPCGYDLAYLADGKLIFAGTELRCWDIHANRWDMIRPGMYWGQRIRLSPDRRYLGEVDQTTSTEWSGMGLRLYGTTTWGPLPPPSEWGETTGGLAFSPDGRWLASSHIVRVGERRRYLRYAPGGFAVPAYDYVVHVRDWPSGGVVQSVDGWQQGVSHLAFSPRGPVLAGTAGPRLRIWDLDAGRELALHKRGTKHFQGLSFTADGRYLATVSNDATVRIWETNSWQEHTTFTWGIGRLLNISFAPDGYRAAAGSDQGQIILWDVDS